MQTQKKRLTEKQNTANTIFTLCEDRDNAFCFERVNVIQIGEHILTIESLIHELNEKVLSEILIKDFNYENRKIIKIKRCKNSLSHFLSPFGEKSLIYPSQYRYKEKPINEEFLILERGVKNAEK